MSRLPALRPIVAFTALIAACISAVPGAAGESSGSAVATDQRARVVFPATVPQGALVIGKLPVGSSARHGDRELRTTPYGSVVFGVARDEAGPVTVVVRHADGSQEAVQVAVSRRDWPTETIRGVPPKTVNPPPALAARIQREQERVAAARERDESLTGFAQPFVRPVDGRISGRFGNQRVYMLPDGTGSPGSAHSGMDIAAANGTPVKAPASGTVTFADPDLYVTGGTLLIDHGHGVSSNFLHLSRIDVAVGDHVDQGQVLGAVGSTGRSTGPHLHWGMNWFTVRVDPLLVLERGDAARAASAGQ